MKQFSYKAYGSRGSLINGKVAAETREGALHKLHGQGVVPIELVNATEFGQDIPWWNRDISFSDRIANKHLVSVFRELATLLAADIRIDDALRITALQPGLPKRVKSALTTINKQITEGQSFSECLRQQKNAFPRIVLASIRAGELSGRLPETISGLAKYLENTVALRDRLTTALLYPCVLVVMAIAAVSVVIFFLVPAIRPLLVDSGNEIPLVIEAMHDVNQAVTGNGLTGILILLATVALLAVLSRVPQVKYAISKSLLSLPVAGPLIKQIQSARFCRTLSLMIGSDVNLLDAVDMAHDGIQNPVFSEAAAEIRSGLETGQPLKVAMNKAKLFPDVAVRLVEMGEETGKLDTMLLRAAEILEGSVEKRVNRMTVLLTPTITILIGLFVGWLIITVMSSILTATDLVGL